MKFKPGEREVYQGTFQNIHRNQTKQNCSRFVVSVATHFSLVEINSYKPNLCVLIFNSPLFPSVTNNTTA